MIKLIIFDIDGVITDGNVIVNKSGEELKSICFRDIDAVHALKRNSFKIAAITGENTDIVGYFEKRFPWDYFYKGCADKVTAIKEIEKLEAVARDEICYIGDSVHDICAIDYAGLSMCPKDAVPSVKERADIVYDSLWDVVNHLNSENMSKEQLFFNRVYKEHSEMWKKIAICHELRENTINAAKLVANVLANGGQVLLFGNGGSAADAQHIATELVSKFYLERRALNAEALNVNTSSLTAIGNDYSFDDVFKRQVEAKGRKGDILIGISTSGKSKNVLKAIEYGKQNGMTTIMFTGENKTGKCFIDVELNVPSNCTPRIQEGHIFLGHLICEYVEAEVCGN